MAVAMSWLRAGLHKAAGSPIFTDIRAAFRGFGHDAGSGLLGIVGVASLGVAATGTLFALADSYIFMRLPFENSADLVSISLDVSNVTRAASIPSFEDWRARRDLFADVAAFEGPEALRVSDPRYGSVALNIVRVSFNFFSVLGTRLTGEDPALVDGGDTLVLLGEGVRRTRSSLGDLLRTDEGGTFRVGAIAEDLVMPEAPASVPIHALRPYNPGRLAHLSVSAVGRRATADPVNVVARLASGTTIAQVEKALSATDAGGHLAVVVRPLAREMTQRTRPLALLAGTAAIVMFIACLANVTNLWFARWIHRERELATRRALGASGRHIVRLVSSEWMTVATIAFAIGGAIGLCATVAIGRNLPAELFPLGRPHFTLRSWACTLVIATALPLLGALATVCREGGWSGAAGLTGSTVSSVASWLRIALGAVQLCLALVLATLATLLIQSAHNLFGQESGYQGDRLAVPVRYGLVKPGGSEVSDALEKLRAVPGVTAVAGTRGSVVNDAMSLSGITVDGVTAMVDSADVTQAYFDVAGMSILRGRPLQPGDEGRRAVVVDSAFVARFWPDREPLGRLVTTGGVQAEVVGIVNDVRRNGLASGTRPTMYRLMGTQKYPVLSMVYVIQADGGERNYGSAIKRALQQAAPAAAIGDVETIGARLANTVRDRTLAMAIVSTFAAVVVGISLSGIVAMVVFVISQRLRVLAIRLALGASSYGVISFVLRETVVATAIGTAAGVLGGQWAAKLVTSMLYGVSPGAWPSLVAPAAAVVAISLAASLAAASRASRLDPNQILRVNAA